MAVQKIIINECATSGRASSDSLWRPFSRKDKLDG